MQVYALNNLNFAYSKMKSTSDTVEQKFQSLMKLYDKSKNQLAVLEVKALSGEALIKHFVSDIGDILRLIQKAKDDGVLEPTFCNQFVNQLKSSHDMMTQKNINDVLSQNDCMDLAYALEDIINNLKRIMKIE